MSAQPNNYTNNSSYNVPINPTEQDIKEYFSILLEAFLVFEKALNVPDEVFHFFLGLMAFSCGKIFFFAKNEWLYPYVHRSEERRVGKECRL